MLIRLADICDIEKGQQIDTDKLEPSKPYKYINGGIKESGYFDEYNTIGNTITVSEGGASCGYVNYVCEPFWCGCHCYRLTNHNVDSRYLYYALKANEQKIMDLRTGVAMPNIRKSSFENLVIKICESESEQQKVVLTLDKITSLIKKSEHELLLLDSIIKSRFIELFGNVIDNEKGWNTYKLNEVCDVRDGTHDSPKYVSNGYPFVTSKNITNGELDFSNVQYISKADYLHFEDRSHVDDGDILMPMIGTVGGAVIVKKDRDFSIKNVCLIKFSRTDMVLNIYIKYVLNSDEMNLYFDSLKKGGNQPFIGLNTIRNLQIPIPTMDKQKEFSTFVDSVDKLKFINGNKKEPTTHHF